MFSARSAAIDANHLRPGPAAGKNVAVEAFIPHVAFKAHLPCAAFLAAGGWAAEALTATVRLRPGRCPRYPRYGTPLAGSTIAVFAVTNVDQIVVGSWSSRTGSKQASSLESSVPCRIANMPRTDGFRIMKRNRPA